jgi:hypothetical protein
VTSGVKRAGAYEPLSDINPLTGDSIEVPNGLLTGAFATSYGAYRDVAISW